MPQEPPLPISQGPSPEQKISPYPCRLLGQCQALVSRIALYFPKLEAVSTVLQSPSSWLISWGRSVGCGSESSSIPQSFPECYTTRDLDCQLHVVIFLSVWAQSCAEQGKIWPSIPAELCHVFSPIITGSHPGQTAWWHSVVTDPSHLYWLFHNPLVKLVILLFYS